MQSFFQSIGPSSSLAALPMAQPMHARPFYAPLMGGGGSGSDRSSSEESIPLTSPATDAARQQQQRRRRRQRRRRQTAAPPPRPSPPPGLRALLPTARRFWADFTLGFADGLTVPFALTAGLSSLGGRTDTVVYAGMAEVSAGCISMGIGGYLSARPAAKAAARPTAPSDPEVAETRYRPNTDSDAPEALADRYLAPLGLPRELHRQAVAHVVAGGAPAAEALREVYDEDDDDDEDEEENDNDNNDNNPDHPVWPVAAGLSVALGYLVGGLLPLGPYLAADSVGAGLRWSFAVCLVALFGFGSAREFWGGDTDDADAADEEDTPREKPRRPWARRRRVPWRRLRKSAGEGLQMVVLGGVAAVAAVLCVRLFESSGGGGGGGEEAPAAT